MTYTASMRLLKYVQARKRKIAEIAGLAVLIFGFVNIAVAAYYNDRTYPNAHVANEKIGSLSGKDLEQYLKSKLLPAKITVSYGNAATAYTPADFGISVDEAAVTKNLQRTYWLPVLNFVTSHTAELALKTDNQKLTKTLDVFASKHPQEKGSDATIRLDIEKSQKQIIAAVKTGQTRVALSTIIVPVPKPAPPPVAVVPPPPAPKKTFTYCTAVRGVDATYLAEFEAKLASVYQDSRGWNLGGALSFVKVSSNCNFTVWLSAASEMPSFGAICDSMWSCAVSPNVVLNFDRWQGASAAWNGGGGTLDDYRTMVINHETGHWLGFYHQNCGGAGQPAPVMQQQSIDMQGCAVNPWPLQPERDQLRKHLKI